MRILVISLVVLICFCGLTHGRGHWEVGIHYSYWSVNVAAPYIEKLIEENIAAEIERYDPSKGVLNFDSSGSNYGLEVRFFPAGKDGSFSVGLSYERNFFNGDVNGDYQDDLGAGMTEEATADGWFKLRPHSFHINLRWELWPQSRVHPYVGFGFGFGALAGDMYVFATYSEKLNGFTLYYEEEVEARTLKEALDELEDQGEEYPLGFLPILQFQIGVRGEIANNIYLLGEVALYDGIVFRMGVAYRF